VSEIFTLLGYIFYYPIFNVLMFLYWLVRDFGLSIVLLTVMVRLALVPMTFKQLHSQRKLMEIQPKIAELKAQYGDDKQGFARAQMQLMRENNVSVFGGCLPLLIQLPILYGLFNALRTGLGSNPNDGLYPFLQFARISSSHPLDTWLRWFSWLPGHPALNLNVADPTHVLPILAALFTFIQMRMIQGRTQPKPAGADPKKTAQQNAQMQSMSIMTYFTPAITLVFAWQYAAGLALYWTVGTLFAIGQQYIIYGWGGLFKGIPRLEQWAAQKNQEHDARREAKLIAKGIISAPTVVEGSLTSAINTTKNSANGTGKYGNKSAKSKDWIEEAKAQSGQENGKKASPRPFPTLMKPKETPALPAPSSKETAPGTRAVPGTPKTQPQNGTGSVNSTKNGASAGASAKEGVKPPLARTKPQPTRRGNPPRSGSLPKPKGGKK